MRIIRPKTFDIEDTRLRTWHEDLFKIFNKNISFGTNVDSSDQNIQGKMIEIADSGLANSAIVLTHNLGYVPRFYDVKYANKATQVFDTGAAWTKTTITIASSTANTKLRIFVH